MRKLLLDPTTGREKSREVPLPALTALADLFSPLHQVTSATGAEISSHSEFWESSRNGSPREEL